MPIGATVDVGNIVELFLGGAQDRIAPSVVDNTFLTPPFGVMLTNAVNPDDGEGGYLGGYCVVGCTDPMVVQLAASSGNPAASAKLYLQKAEGSEGGATDQSVIDATYTGPCPLGQCMPEGPTGATRLRYMTWEPQPPNGRTCQRASDLHITSSTTLVDFASAPVKAGRRYKIEADLVFSAVIAGGIDVSWAVSAAVGRYLLYADIIGFNVTILYAANYINPGARVGIAGPQTGVAQLRGVVNATADGYVSVQASQHASNASSTIVLQDSWFRVTEV